MEQEESERKEARSQKSEIRGRYEKSRSEERLAKSYPDSDL
jgi:hypothetical protein